MNTTKKLTISNYIKILIPELNITKITKKKHNYIINGTIPFKQTITIPITELQAHGIDNHLLNPYPNELNHNIAELKTYTIPIKDITPMLPVKRKLPKVNKIHIS